MTNKSKKKKKGERFCPVCEKMREFAYDPKIGHSRCTECGGRNMVAAKDQLQAFERDIKALVKSYNENGLGITKVEYEQG